jgi:hypothetical protein
MATSGSYNYSLSAQGIIDAAYDKLNLIGLGQVVSARKLTTRYASLKYTH